jgi:proteasome lid subunit RPN8/RPN11
MDVTPADTSDTSEPSDDSSEPSDRPEPQVPPDRDVSQVDPAQYPARELPRIRDLRGEGFQVVITRSALNDMHRHGRSQRDVEVCGVIVGNVYHDEKGPYLYVEASIKGDHAAGRTAQVTFTAHTWNHINDEMEQHHPGRKILGWYHTHPGFGIFLSEMDLFIQNNFFPEPWQVAYVYDPKSGEDGIFVWKSGHATLDPYLVDPDTINTDPPGMRGGDVAASSEDAPATSSGKGTATGATLAELTARVQSLERRARVQLAALFVVTGLAVAGPIASHLLLPPVNAPPPKLPEVPDGPIPWMPPTIAPFLRQPSSTTQPSSSTLTTQPATQPQ